MNEFQRDMNNPHDEWGFKWIYNGNYVLLYIKHTRYTLISRYQIF